MPQVPTEPAMTRLFLAVLCFLSFLAPAADPKLGPGRSALGVAQAHLVGARLAGITGGIDGLHVSPLQRARDTAATIGAALPHSDFEVLEDLAECTPPTRRESVMKEEK